MTPSLPSIQAQAQVKWGKWVDESVKPPIGVAATKQKTWDSVVIESCFSHLLNQQAANPRERARLQACSQKESGAWFTAPPISSLGLRMGNATIRIATSLQLGAHLCAPHDCTHCERRVDETWLHGLSCRRSTGRLPRHNQLNTIIKQSLASANIQSVLEPQGLSRTNGKRPDEMTITPWAQLRSSPHLGCHMLGHTGSFQHPYSHVWPRTGGRHGREKKEGNLLGNLAQPSLCPSRCGDHGIFWGGHDCLPSPSGITHPGNVKGPSRLS